MMETALRTCSSCLKFCCFRLLDGVIGVTMLLVLVAGRVGGEDGGAGSAGSTPNDDDNGICLVGE